MTDAELMLAEMERQDRVRRALAESWERTAIAVGKAIIEAAEAQLPAPRLPRPAE